MTVLVNKEAINDRAHLEDEKLHSKVRKHLFQASAANGMSHKLNSLTEMEQVLQFVITAPPEAHTVICLNWGSRSTYTSCPIRCM